MNRPTSATVFGILNVIFALFGILGLVSTTISLFVPQPGNPVLELMNASPFYRNFNLVNLALGLVATIVLGVSGLGLLLGKLWGRTLAIAWSVYAILSGIVGMVVAYFFLVTPLMEQAAAMPDGAEKFGAIGGSIGAMVGGCVGLFYPVILLIFMMRPAFAAALRTHSQAAGAGDPYAGDPYAGGKSSGGKSSGGTDFNEFS